MKTATGWSTHQDTSEAIRQAYELARRHLHDVHLIALYATPNYCAALLLDFLKRVESQAQVIGCTTHKGIITEHGWHSESHRGLGLMLISDEMGAYGVAAHSLSSVREAREVSAKLAEEACIAAGRPGELPAHVLVHSTMGYEEQVLLGIQDSFGPATPIRGGTAADLDLQGQWSVFATDASFPEGLTIAALYPSTAIYSSIRASYSATPCKGYVTSGEGRILHEIDGKPALEVYREWSQSPTYLSTEPNLTKTRLAPLGKPQGDLGSLPFYSLSQPIRALEGGSIELASPINRGELLFLMRGTEEDILFRPSSMTAHLRELEGFSEEHVAGILFMSSAGALATERKTIDSMVDLIKLQTTVPFIMPFSFAEQGSLSQGISINGNLMVSCLMVTNKVFPGFRRVP